MAQEGGGRGVVQQRGAAAAAAPVAAAATSVASSAVAAAAAAAEVVGAVLEANSSGSSSDDGRLRGLCGLGVGQEGAASGVLGFKDVEGDTERDRLLKCLSRSQVADLVSSCSTHIVVEARLQVHVVFSALSQFGCPSLLCCSVLPQKLPQQHQQQQQGGRTPASSSSTSAPPQCCGGPSQYGCCSSRGVWIYSEAKRRFLGRLDARHFATFFLHWHRWLLARHKQKQPHHSNAHHHQQQQRQSEEDSLQSASSSPAPTSNGVKEPQPAACDSSSSCGSATGHSTEEPLQQDAVKKEAAGSKPEDAELAPPWALTLEALRNMCGASGGAVQRVLPNCDAATALVQLLDSKAPYLCVINEGRRAPLALLSAHGFLLHIVSELRGSFPIFATSVSAIGLGTHENVLTYCLDSSAAGFLSLLEETGYSSIPLVDRDGVYAACFSLEHFLVVVLKRLNEGTSLDLTAPIGELLEAFQQLQWQHRLLCSAAAAAATAASNDVLLLPTFSSSGSSSSRRGAAAAAALGRPAVVGTPQPVYRGTVELEDAVHLTLQDAILRILFSDEQKIIWLSERRGFDTSFPSSGLPSDVWHFLLPIPNLQQQQQQQQEQQQQQGQQKQKQLKQ
ncbi:hypothetical protein Esti_005982 [Eimeria stiedai]